MTKSWKEIFPDIPVTPSNIIHNSENRVFTSEPPPPTLFMVPDEVEAGTSEIVIKFKN